MLLSRLPGTDLATGDPTPGLLQQLGREMARIHRLSTEGLSLLPHDTGYPNPALLVKELHRQGHLDSEAADWLNTWAEHLAAGMPQDPAPTLIHGDLTPTNIIATPGRALSGIVDWGDATLADPATDFAKLPPWWLPPVLEGYRDHHDPDHPWEARILWHHLLWALKRLSDPTARPGPRHWSAPPASRLLALLRLFASQPPAPWPELAPPPARVIPPDPSSGAVR